MGYSDGLLLICILCVSSLSSIVYASFHPQDRFFIDCGGSNALVLDDGRVFEPESGNPHVTLSSHTHDVVSVIDEKALSKSNRSVLYSTAQVFRVTSTYSFRTKQIGRHWIRLHLYPIQNPHFNLKSAVFSVVANGITLLHGFSFSKVRKVSRLVKEYVVEVDGKDSKKLVLTFSPWNGSVAFINAIEVVSVPGEQFPSTNITAVPLEPGIEIPSHVAFETAYRINMGGPHITPKNDTLWRTWEPDQAFLVNAASARNVTANPRSIKYPDGVSVEIAPNWVYATAQEMADANVLNQKFNISWGFKVENGFSYLIRLHFCDIVSTSLNNLLFNVYVNQLSALDCFDISSRTMSLSAAYFIDFVTNVSMGSDRILVQIGPPMLTGLSSNAILNGLEIMKMSNSRDSLDVNLPGEYYTDLKSPVGKKKWMMLAVCSSSAGFVVFVILSTAFYLYLRRIHQKKKNTHCSSSTWLPLPTHVGLSDSKVSIDSSSSTSPSLGLGRVFAFSDISEATNNFDKKLVLGVGGFGMVYRGVLENGSVVAVKRGNPRSQQGLTEFRTEIEMLSKMRHRHLVSLIGYCEELNEMILVYEFMAGGPLRKHLYGSDFPSLTWKQRLEICIGAAKGLHYLHTGAAETIIHRDVKSTNILLDENLTAKVADFGLSKLGPTLNQTHVSTAVKGSFGYLDPDYYRRQQLTEKSDVYSFGVVLLEVLCARPAISPSLPREEVNIAEWAMNFQKKGRLEKIMDRNLVGSVNLESLRKFGETAEKCLLEYGVERPTMGDVLWNLEYALQLQEASIQFTASAANSANYISDIPEWLPQIEIGNGDGHDHSDQESDTTSSAVFSELEDPRGR
ncbi:PREDICTED: receptor-like protein kinase THESEUS 1 [Fragaria vesca subsp. vesca]|uniref:receptor-like protein kinase THESEUS 1 n=1 Tax=Fragaria vesca subsp. vesca TaxID=101020 RepID=UPI0002C300BE|nr:PREDICTED: receptor-like protein kinase THESEUS 1 [Fragaria vesca subsp. vesca]